MKHEQKLAYNRPARYSHSETLPMSPRPAFSPKKLPRQSRSTATFEAIVDAAAHILREGGYEALTTNRVAERAGVSVGSLYQYFPNKEAILAELSRRHVVELERGMTEVLSRADGMSLVEIVAALIEDNARAHSYDPALHKVLFEEAPGLGPHEGHGPHDWRDGFAQRAVDIVVTLLERHRTEITVTDLPLAALVVAQSVEAVIHGAAMRGDPRLVTGEITAHATRLVVAYLTSPSVEALPVKRRRDQRRAVGV